jgi:mycoredoxin
MTASASAPTTAGQPAAGPIIFYSKTGCPWCNAVRHLLREHGVPYEERDVRKDGQLLAELRRETNQDSTPTIDIGGEWLVDTDAQVVARRLGVPKPAEVKRAS